MRGSTNRLAHNIYLAGFCLITGLITAGCSPSRSETTATTIPFSTATATASPSAVPTITNTPRPTLIASATNRPTFTPTASITPAIITSIQPHPLALNERNVSEDMKMLAIYGTGSPNDIAWSHDGTVFAVATGRGVWLYDGSTFDQTGFIDVQDSVTMLSFSPDGQVLALAIRGSVSLWDVISGTKILDLQGEFSSIWKLVYGRGGHVAAVGGCITCASSDRKVILWETTAGNQVLVENLIFRESAIDISPNGDVFAFVKKDQVYIYDIQRHAVITMLNYSPIDIVFSIDSSKLFMTFLQSETNMVLDIEKQEKVSYLGQCGGMIGISDQVVVCNNFNDSIVIFDRMTGRMLSVLKNYKYLQRMTVNFDGGLLAYVEQNDVKVIDLNNRQDIETLKFDNSYDPAIAMIIKGSQLTYLAASINQRDIKLWDLETGNMYHSIQTNDENMVSLAFGPDQYILVSTTENGIVHLWNVQTSDLLFTFNISKPLASYGESITGPIFFSPDGLHLGIVAHRFYLFDLNLQTTQILKNGEFLGDMFMPDSHSLSLGYAANGSILLSDSETAKKKFELPYLSKSLDNYGDGVYIESVAIDPTGKYFAAGSRGGEINIWDLRTQELIQTYKGLAVRGADGGIASVRNMVFNPATNLLVSVGLDNTTRLWDIFSGQIRTLDVCCFAGFTPDGRYLVTAGEGVIRLWGIPTN